MLRKFLLVGLAFGCVNPIHAASVTTPARANLSAAEIANRNVAARGGLQAWRAVQSISETGKLGAGGDKRKATAEAVLAPAPGSKRAMAQLPSSPRLAEEAQLPFVMEMQRPRKVRFELQFKGQTAVQVYDGANGWKLRPFLNRLEVEPYTADELKLASMQSELDGPLVDYAAKGTLIELAGMEKVEDHDTYKLKLTMKDGHTTHVWIDAQTFLEAKVEGQPRRLDGKMHPVEVYYRDYRAVNGLQIPFVLETRVLPFNDPEHGAVDHTTVPAEKIVIEKVQVNPRLEASHFVKPQVEVASERR
jgi:hypothetical protein